METFIAGKAREGLTAVARNAKTSAVRAVAEKSLAQKERWRPSDETEDTGAAISGIQLFWIALLCLAMSCLVYLRWRSAKRKARG